MEKVERPETEEKSWSRSQLHLGALGMRGARTFYMGTNNNLGVQVIMKRGASTCYWSFQPEKRW